MKVAHPWTNIQPDRQRHRGLIAAYTLKHVQSNQIFIGATEDVYSSLARHASSLRLESHYNPILQKAFNRSEEFVVSMLSVSTEGRNRLRARLEADAIKRGLLLATFGSVNLANIRMPSPYRPYSIGVWVDGEYHPSISKAVAATGIPRKVLRAQVEVTVGSYPLCEWEVFQK